jgi:hypothetical protein
VDRASTLRLRRIAPRLGVLVVMSAAIFSGCARRTADEVMIAFSRWSDAANRGDSTTFLSLMATASVHGWEWLAKWAERSRSLANIENNGELPKTIGGIEIDTDPASIRQALLAPFELPGVINEGEN